MLSIIILRKKRAASENFLISHLKITSKPLKLMFFKESWGGQMVFWHPSFCLGGGLGPLPPLATPLLKPDEILHIIDLLYVKNKLLFSKKNSLSPKTNSLL